MDIGKKVRQARSAAGISQADLAERAGMSQAYLSQIEKGNRVPRIDTLQKIASAISMELIIEFE